ncbi:hypothetical protein D3C75_1259660 [compost metagenome]
MIADQQRQPIVGLHVAGHVSGIVFILPLRTEQRQINGKHHPGQILIIVGALAVIHLNPHVRYGRHL